MGKREKVMFTIFVVIVQVLQFLLVYSIAWLNNRTIEFLFIFFSFQMNRMVFGKSYHKAKKALDSIPSTYTDLQKQVNEVEDRELKDANGITQELTITDGYAQLTDTATKRLNSLVIKGNTVQNSTKGLNLINCTPKTTTINGITMVNNGDGTYTVNGTATDDFDIALAPYTTKQNIYYTLSGCPSGGSKTTYYLDPRGYDYDTGRGITIINQNEDFSNYIRIVIKKDVTVNNLLFKPMFNEGQTAQPFALYSKYVAGNIDGNLYSSKGLKPARYYGATPLPANTTNTNTSYSGLINQCHKRGSFYSGGMTCDYKYILTTFYLKYGTLNTQSIMRGCDNYSAQYEASIKSSTNNTYFPLTKAQADYFPVGASVSIGYKYGGSNLDRYYSTVSIYADNVKIIKKVALDDSNTALYLDTNTPFNTANTSSGAVFCSSMQWRSGFSDDILGRDGCPCETKSELTNGKFPIVIQGIECMVGGYETYGNAFMDVVDATGKREVYIQNDASLLTTNITTAKSTYKKSPYAIQPTKLNNWNYITRIDFDLENGAFVQSNCGQDGSGTAVGFADGVYVDNASSGQREFLGFGSLGHGSSVGLSCLRAEDGVGTAYWYILARLSINGVGGELTA